MASLRNDVAIVVVSYNSEAVIDTCLRAALAQDVAEVMVVDNASQDATARLIGAHFPTVRLLPLGENVGFARGSNIGLMRTAAPFVLFLNDDAILLPGYVKTLVSALASDPGAASAIGKLVRRKDGKQYIDSAGIVLNAHALRPMDRGHNALDVGQYDAPQTIFGPSGAAALYRRDALFAQGNAGFDASYFAYYEDVDLAWRLGRQGWRHLYVPDAVALHDRRGPQAKPLAVTARAYINRYTTWRKNERLGRFLMYMPLALAWELARLARILVRQPRLFWAIMSALRERR